jgi:hypothetical protein
MPRFAYTARTSAGEIVSDEIEASHAQEARQLIRVMGCELQELKEVPVKRKDPVWVVSGDDAAVAENSRKKSSEVVSSYAPLVDTFRLYCGWLLAWYFFIYALGGYQLLRALPLRFSLFVDLLSSSLIAQCAFAVFLFLLFSDLHRLMRLRLAGALTLAGMGFLLLAVYAVNV